jgi:spermidine synthase
VNRDAAAQSSPGLYAFVVIGSVALSMLMYELLLTRVSALRLFFHFGFLAVSNCLLGIGAAGSVIALYQESWRQNPRHYIWLSCVLYLASLVVAWVFVLNFELPANFNLSDPAQFLHFSVFNVVTALPFAFGGGAVGMVLSFFAGSINRLYFTDLVCASLGCLAFPFFLEAVGAGGSFVLVAMTAAVAILAAAPAAPRRPVLVFTLFALAVGVWLLPRLDSLFPVPGKEDLQLTATYTANTSDVTEFSRWSPNSRIDLVPIPPDRRILVGRGTHALGIPLPDTKFILQDGTAGTLIYNFSEQPRSLRALELSLYSAAMRLVEQPSVFIIGVGGGNDVWAARAAGARSVKGVELNQPILDVHTEVLPHFSRVLLADPSIELVHGEGRSALMREQRLYDVIQMTGVDTWTGLASGAYVLAENYLYTSDAIQEMYARLEDGGVLQITRFGLEVEALRLLSNVNDALRSLAVGDFPDSVICLASADGLFTMLLKKGVYTADEIRRARAFAKEAGLISRYLPGLPSKSPAARFILSSDKASFIRAYPRNITPTTDDRPYFFNFTRWDLWGRPTFGTEPASASQGDPSFILAQLFLSTLLATGLILLPLVASRRHPFDRRFAARFLVYFVGLGAGFIAIEVSLMQKLTLLLGHPLYSLTVTLFTILFFAGLGSLVSANWFVSSRRRVWLVPAGIALSIALFVVFSPQVVESAIGLPLAARVAAAIAMLAPTAFLLGVPLPFGIRLLNGINPSLIPWCWAVNGCLSVIGSVLTVVASMNFGFNAVLLGAAGLYIVSFAALPRGVGVRG